MTIAASSWPLKPLGAVSRIFAGTGAPQGVEYFSKDGPLFVRVSDLSKYGRTRALSTAESKLSQKALDSCSLVKARKGTVVFPRSGAAIFTNNRGILDVDAFIVAHLMAIEPSDEVTSEWIYWWLCQIDLAKHSNNDAYPSLKQSDVEKIQIPLPSISQQKRIAAILSEQMAAVERARAAAENQNLEARLLCSRYLLRLFKDLGGSTQNRPLESVAELLPSKSISTAGDAVVETVTTACLTEVGFDPRGIKTARMATGDVSNCMLGAEEVLVARSNTPELVGRAAMFVNQGKPIVASDLTIRIKAGPQLLAEYLAGYLSYLYVSKYWVERAGGASGTMKKITRTQIADLLIPVPELAVQERVVSQLRNVVRAAKQVEALVSGLSKQVNLLPAAYLRRAFSGQL